MEQFNATTARRLSATAGTTTPTKQLAAIQKAAKLGKTEAWFENLSEAKVKGLQDLGFVVTSMPDRNVTAFKVSW